MDDQAGARCPDNDGALRDQGTGRQVIRCPSCSPDNRRSRSSQCAAGDVKRLVLRRTSNCRTRASQGACRSVDIRLDVLGHTGYGRPGTGQGAAGGVGNCTG
jgi:hypothetical protein